MRSSEHGRWAAAAERRELGEIGEELQGHHWCGMRRVSPKGPLGVVERNAKSSGDVPQEGRAVWEVIATSLHDDVGQLLTVTGVDCADGFSQQRRDCGCILTVT